jgi:DNA-binding CsgD family transcriptional regulator
VGIQTDHYITGDPAFAVNREGEVVLWNAAAEQSLGYTSAEALGSKCWDLLCGQDANGNRYCVKHCPLIEMAFLHEPVNAFTSSFGTASHGKKQFSVSCLTVFDEPGDEMLLHICHPEDAPVKARSYRQPVTAPADALSQRELEVVTLLSSGVSTRNIASQLSISIRTVRTHIQHLMYKLRVHKRRDAIEAARRLKLI